MDKRFFNILSEMKNLKKINLSGHIHFFDLFLVFKFENLTSLIIMSNHHNFDVNNQIILGDLTKISNLHELKLTSNNFIINDFQITKPKCLKVVDLDFNSCNLEIKAIRNIETFKENCENLEFISIKYNNPEGKNV